MREAFALQKLLTFFSTKNIGIFEKLTSKNSTKCLLTTSLVLNKGAQAATKDNGVISALDKKW